MRLTALLLSELARIGPGMATLVWIPRTLRLRMGALMVTAMREWCDAAAAAPGDGDCRQRWRASLMLWGLPQMLLRRPDAAEGATPTQQAERAQAAVDVDKSLGSILRRRLQLAEYGRWNQLASETLEARIRQEVGERGGDRLTTSTGEEGDRLKALQAAVVKASGGGLRAAVQILTGAGKADATAANKEKILKLVSPSLPDGEHEALEEELRLCRQCAAQAPKLKESSIRRRTRALRGTAEPGASRWRNSHLQLVAAHPGGSWELTRWSQTWADGNIARHEACLWGQCDHSPHQT